MSNKLIYTLKKQFTKDQLNILTESNAMIAGGSLLSLIKNTKVSDYDVYFKNRADCYNFINNISRGPVSYSCISKTNRSCVLKRGDSVPFNVIFFDMFENLSGVFTAFDYECCKIGYDFKEQKLETGKDTWSDLTTNTLRYTGASRFPIGALIRMQKYIKKGYTIDTGSLLKLTKDLSPMLQLPAAEIVDQLSGMYGLNVDVTKLNNLSDVISEFDKNFIPDNQGKTVDPEWEVIFNDIFKHYSLKNYKITMINDKVVNATVKLGKDNDEKDEILTPLPFPLTLWKYVSLDGKSFYNKNYVYKANTMAIDSQHGLYGCFKYQLKNATYHSNIDKALLEMLVFSPDDVLQVGYDNVKVKSCFVKSITPIPNKEDWVAS